jgi:cytochrome b subunit of formate dehydrogenase
MKNKLLFPLIILNIAMILISGIIIFKEYLITHTKII